MIKKDMISGLIVCIIIAILAKLTSSILPLIGSTSLAIIIGIIAGNTLAKDKKHLPGVKFWLVSSRERDKLFYFKNISGMIQFLTSLILVREKQKRMVQ